MSGGPGCSGELALFKENGPWSLDNKFQKHSNPFSWTKSATVLWIDQPAGTGYSYADSPYVHDEAAVAVEMEVFLVKVFEKYPQYAHLPFFIVGESYGGKYVPAVVNRLVDAKKTDPHFPITVEGLAVGNGVFNSYYQLPSQASFAAINNLINATAYESLLPVITTCQTLISAKKFEKASSVCGGIMLSVLEAAGNINPMNYHQHCKIQDCFVYSNVTGYMNLESTKKELGVKESLNWQSCAMGEVTFTDEDQMTPSSLLIERLLDSSPSLRVLIYYGDLDLVMPYNGGLEWMMNMSWSGAGDFRLAPTLPYEFQEMAAGTLQSTQNLSYLRVFDAGHMVPMDQPEVSLDFFTKFLHNKLVPSPQ
eukprot:TRINITY_DN915_c0_g1_i1.p1 TRINITY_DN915_c0_g1~~TRINITY_DN915_c0_g1_i1.p1  ORF type:complete len:428 (+),score=98.16 TRINITY_DN915_c0_g1_i1:190-1284(+)